MPMNHVREVIAVLVGREFKGRYKNTSVGMAWSIINPLLYLLVFYFVFKLVLDLGIPRYASFALIGVLAWMWFQNSLFEAVTSITSNPSMVGQPGFPVASLPVVSVAVNLINFVIAFPLLLVVLIVERSPLGLPLLALPAIIVAQFALTASVAFFVAALNVHFRDVQLILAVVLQLGYFLTPVFYAMSFVPAEYRTVFDLNPMMHIIQSYRAVLLEGTWPDFSALGWIAAGSLVFAYASFRYFEHARYRFLEQL